MKLNSLRPFSVPLLHPKEPTNQKRELEQEDETREAQGRVTNIISFTNS